MTVGELAFYTCVAAVFAVAAVRAFYNWFREDRHETATLYTMVAVLSVFVLFNYD